MNKQFEQAQQMGNLWLELMTKMLSATVTADATQPPPDAARHLRDITLAAMGQQADKYMRSPQFLELMKQSLDAQIAWRKQLNQFFTDAHHSVQGVAKTDVDALSLSIRQMERRVLNRIETLCEKVEEVSRRIDAIESGKSGGNGGGGGDNGNAGGDKGSSPRLEPPAAIEEATVEPGME